jgi:hypothetical protein
MLSVNLWEDLATLPTNLLKGSTAKGKETGFGSFPTSELSLFNSAGKKREEEKKKKKEEERRKRKKKEGER